MRLAVRLSPRAPAGGSALYAPPALTIVQGQAPHHFEGQPSVIFASLKIRVPRGAPLMASGVLSSVRSLRPDTSLSAPAGSASRELRFAQYPALRLTSPRFVQASLGLTASARCCHAARKIWIAGSTPTAPPRPHLKRPLLRCGLLLYFKKWRFRGLHTCPPRNTAAALRAA
jgi:hypothetical protein